MVEETKMVIAIRKDLDLGKGKIAVQVAHAAVTLALYSSKNDTKIFKKWTREGQKKVVIRIAGFDELMELKVKLEGLGFYVCQISDAGYTQVPSGTVTCIGVGPVKADDIDPVTSEYPLM